MPADDLVPAASPAGPPQCAGSDLRAGHGPEQGGVPQGRAQHRPLARLPYTRDGRTRPGQLQHAEDPRRSGQLRARGRRRGVVPARPARGRSGAGRHLRHQHGKLLVAAACELRSPHRRGGERGRLLQSQQHNLHTVVAALQTDVHVMAGYDDETKFDAEVASGMTVIGHLGAIRCPTLLVTGEFDPLCPLEDAIAAYQELTTEKELWVLENQYHPLWSLGNLGGLDVHDYALDWIQGVFTRCRSPTKQGRIAYIKEHGMGPWSDCEWTPPVGPTQAYL